MLDDPILTEIREFRISYAAKFNYDLKAIYEDIKRQESQSKRVFVSYSPKPIEPISKNSQ